MNKKYVLVYFWLSGFSILFNFYSFKYYELSHNIDLDIKENLMCKKKSFEYNNSISMRYIMMDYPRIVSSLKECNIESYFEFVKWTYLNGFSIELYEINLLFSKLTKQMKKENSSVVCVLYRFDKIKNYPQDILENYQSVYFDPSKNYTIIVNTIGFYSIKCNEKNQNRAFFQEVISILPRNMSKLVEKRQNVLDILKNKELQFNKSFSEFTKIKDREFDECNIKPTKTNTDKMNVLLLMLDSMSLSNFKRAFPLSYKYLIDSDDYLIYENYNSVGENTFPNILTLFTGYSALSISDLNITTEMDLFYKIDPMFHDHLPLIWKQFEKLGYLTLFQEDWSQVGMFNYYKSGFRYPPTAYYVNPYWFRYHEIKNGTFHCHQNQHSFDR